MKRARGSSAPLATADELRGAHVPRQVRSVEALQRIAAAGLELLLTREYEDVSIADIAAAAGVSVGTFYTKFSSKERLVVFVMGDLAEEFREEVLFGLDRLRADKASMTEVVRWYLEKSAEVFTAYRGVLRPATLIARQTRDPDIRSLLARFNAEVHGRLRDLLLDLLPTRKRATKTDDVNTAILMFSATLREVFIYGEPVSRLAPGQRQLIDRLTQCTVLYLEGA